VRQSCQRQMDKRGWASNLRALGKGITVPSFPTHTLVSKKDIGPPRIPAQPKLSLDVAAANGCWDLDNKKRGHKGKGTDHGGIIREVRMRIKLPAKKLVRLNSLRCRPCCLSGSQRMKKPPVTMCYRGPFRFKSISDPIRESPCYSCSPAPQRLQPAITA
jgi:hypothetical protein